MTATLTDICTAIVDCEHKTAPASDGFALSVGTKAMKDGRLVLGSCKPVSKETYGLWTRRLVPAEGDLILAREAPVGDVVRVPKGLRVCLGQRTVLIRPDPDRVDPRFLHYWLLGPIAQTDMHSRAAGATVPHLNVEDIRALDVTGLPDDRKLQSQAGKILGATDDLIENNRRRTALLEQMAQVIYREWFVHFRYPGHEDDELVDSPLGPIPEGWQTTTVGESFTVVLGGTPSRRNPEYWDGGDVPWLNSGKTNELRVIEPSEYITALGLAKSSTKLMPRKTTLVAITGATLGQVSMLEAEMCANQSVVGIYDETGSKGEWIYRALLHRIREIIQSASGGAQQHINKGVIEDVVIPKPPPHVLAEFNALAAPKGDEIATLLRMNRSLRVIRDLLLPKLVTGAIDVSRLDLDGLFEESAA